MFAYTGDREFVRSTKIVKKAIAYMTPDDHVSIVKINGPSRIRMVDSYSSYFDCLPLGTTKTS